MAKQKGWLDKYGEEINANEGHSSAPKEWMGEGYSNVGRNYSPAWGGQFEDGGYIPQAQTGLLTPTIGDTIHLNQLTNQYIELLNSRGKKNSVPSKPSSTLKENFSDYIKKGGKSYKYKKPIHRSQLSKELQQIQNKEKEIQKFALEKGISPTSKKRVNQVSTYYDQNGMSTEFLETPNEGPYVDIYPTPVQTTPALQQENSTPTTTQPIQNVPQGHYRVEYFDPELKQETHRMFMSQAESDAFAKELGQRNLTSGVPAAGNITQRYDQFAMGGKKGPGPKKPFFPVSNWSEPKYVAGQNPEGHYGYSDNTIWYDPNSEIENVNNPWWMGHEQYHHYQTLTGKNPRDRRGQEVDNEVNKMIQANPELQFVPINRLVTGSKPDAKGRKSFLGAEDRIYEDPSTLEGAARLYEQYIDNGGKSIFPKPNLNSTNNYPTESAPLRQGLDFAMGGSLPGSVGFTYARTNSPAPSNGPYAKKTLSSAQTGVNITETPQVQSMEEGETAAKDWLQNWYTGRAKDPKFTDLANKRLDALQKLKVEGDPDLLRTREAYGIYGFYPNNYTPIVDISSDPTGIQTSNILHEDLHGLSNLAPQENIPNILAQNDLLDPYENYDLVNEDEKLARLYQFRKRYGIDPNKEYTTKDMQEIMDDFNSRPTPKEKGKELDPNFDWNIEQLFQMIGNDPEKLRNLNRDVVKNNSKQSTVAKNGMTYYQNGLDWKPKSISKNGGWLESYAEGGQAEKICYDENGYRVPCVDEAVPIEYTFDKNDPNLIRYNELKDTERKYIELMNDSTFPNVISEEEEEELLRSKPSYKYLSNDFFDKVDKYGKEIISKDEILKLYEKNPEEALKKVKVLNTTINKKGEESTIFDITDFPVDKEYRFIDPSNMHVVYGPSQSIIGFTKSNGDFYPVNGTGYATKKEDLEFLKNQHALDVYLGERSLHQVTPKRKNGGGVPQAQTGIKVGEEVRCGPNQVYLEGTGCIDIRSRMYKELYESGKLVMKGPGESVVFPTMKPFVVNSKLTEDQKAELIRKELRETSAQNQTFIGPATEQSWYERAFDIATHPGTAIRAYNKKGYVPNNLGAVADDMGGSSSIINTFSPVTWLKGAYNAGKQFGSAPVQTPIDVLAGFGNLVGYGIHAIDKPLPGQTMPEYKSPFGDTGTNARALNFVGNVGEASPLLEFAPFVNKVKHLVNSNSPAIQAEKQAAMLEGENWVNDWYSNPNTVERIAEIEKNDYRKGLFRWNSNNTGSKYHGFLFDDNPTKPFFAKETMQLTGNARDSKIPLWKSPNLGMYKYGKASVSPYQTPKEIVNTVVEELVHARTNGKMNEEMTNLLNAAINPVDVSANQWLAYATQAKEAYPRIMRLRKAYGLTPGQEVSEQLVDQMIKESGRGAVEKEFMKAITDKKAFREAFNKLPSVIGGTMISDAIINSSSESDKNKSEQKKEGGVVKDDNGYWNPDNWGKVVEIGSPNITMQGVNQPLVGISDKGDVQYMEPGKDYKFKGKKVKEYPVGKNGVNQQDEKVDEQLDQLTNFTNYNKPTKGGWLDKYN